MNDTVFWSLAMCPGVLFARSALAPAFMAAEHHRTPVQYGLVDLADRRRMLRRGLQGHVGTLMVPTYD